MNLEYNPEQVALASTVRRFLTDKADIAGHVRQQFENPRGTTDEVWRGFAALGTTGLLVAPEHGGAGGTMVDAGIAAGEIGAGVFPGPWLSCVTATRALSRFRLEDTAADLLEAIADGSTIATVGPLTGPGPERIGDGPDVLLRGEIHHLADAVAADIALIPTREGPGWVLHAVSTEHVQLSPEPGIDLTRKTFRAHLDDVPARTLGRTTDAAVAALRDDVLILAAADAVGAAQRLLDMTIEHAKSRRQFGQPIGSFQAVQQLCVSMFQTVELARGGVLRALWAADHADDADRRLAAARIKAYGNRLATVGDTAIQVFGGIGYTWEHDAHLYLRRLLAFSTFLGTGDHYLEQLGAALVSTCRAKATAESG